MKTIRIVFSALVVAFVFNTASLKAGGNPGKKTTAHPKASTTLNVDPARSTVVWTAKKVGGEHTGNVKIAQGVLHVQANKLAGGTFELDMTSITDTDLTNETFNAKLTSHLKSDDFFSVEKHPTSTFTITRIDVITGAKAGEPNYNITGDLTIKGTTKPITFPAIVKITGDGAEASAKFDVNRIDWDLKYRSSLLGTAADKIIDDNFTIDLKIVADKKEVAKK